jgi:hypothetical protein
MFFVVMVRIVWIVLQGYVGEKETAGVKVGDLKKGQVLTEGQALTVEHLVQVSGVGEDYHETKNYGLNYGQIGILQRLYRRHDILVTYKTMAMGPLMLAGVVVCMVTSDSLIRIVLDAIARH